MRYPWSVWALGVIVLVATSIFVDRVYSKSVQLSEQGKSWWKYLVAGIIYLIAFGIIANGRVESFTMSRDLGRVFIRSTKPLCLISKLRRERNVDKELRTIVDIRVEAAGEFSGEIDTRTYKVHFEFEDGTHATALESRCKKKTLARCQLVKDFLFACASSSIVTAIPPQMGNASPRKQAMASAATATSLPRLKVSPPAPENAAIQINVESHD